MRRLLIAAFLLLSALAGPAMAQERPPPFGIPAQGPQASAPGEATWLDQARAQVLIWQSRANKAVNEHMVALRDGAGSGAFLAALLFCFGYGVFHTLGPGHGKAVVVSYFAGREAGIRRGLAMGTRIAATHVLSAIVIVTAADFLLRRVMGAVPSEVVEVRLVSYGAIALVGLHLIWRAWRSSTGQGNAHCGHDHGHHHHHDHHHGHGPRRSDRWAERLLSVGVGLVPCTGAMLILLFALANGLMAAGVALVAAIGVGMAAAMAAIGMLTIAARRFVITRMEAAGAGTRRLALAAEWAGGLAVFLLGAALVWANL